MSIRAGNQGGKHDAHATNRAGIDSQGEVLVPQSILRQVVDVERGRPIRPQHDRRVLVDGHVPLAMFWPKPFAQQRLFLVGGINEDPQLRRGPELLRLVRRVPGLVVLGQALYAYLLVEML